MDKQERQNFFSETIEQHKGILFKVARAYCPNEEDRQDLIQEMMIQIWKSIHKYNDQYKISTWLYRISLNVAISYYRQNRNRPGQYPVMKEQRDESEREDKLEHERHLNLLEQFINELKEIEKALMILYLENKSHNEIAGILGMSVTNVGTKIGRIKDKLKARFTNIKV